MYSFEADDQHHSIAIGQRSMGVGEIDRQPLALAREPETFRVLSFDCSSSPRPRLPTEVADLYHFLASRVSDDHYEGMMRLNGPSPSEDVGQRSDLWLAAECCC